MDERFDRLTLLQSLTERLAGLRDRDAVARVVLGEILAELGGSTGSLCLLTDDGTELELIAHAGYAPDVTSAYARFPVDAPLPASEVVRTGRPVFLASPEERDRRFPALLEAPLVQDRAYAVLPLAGTGDRALGALVVGFAEPRTFEPDLVDLLVALAAQCAIALERAALLADAERDAARLAFLADASAVLADSLDFRETLRRVAELAVPRLADWCALYLLDESGAARPLMTAHADPRQAALVAAANERFPVVLDGPGLGATLRTGRTEYYPALSDEELGEVAVDEEHHSLLRAIGFGSGAAVALRARGRILGAIAVANARGRPMLPGDVALVEQVAERAAVAIDNARLFEEARVAADRMLRLQQATAALAEARSIDEVADVVLARGQSALGARGGVVLLADHHRGVLRLAASAGYPRLLEERWSVLPLDLPTPASQVIRTGEALFVENPAAFVAQFPALQNDVPQGLDRAWAVLPLATTGAPFGAVAYTFDGERRLDAGERVLVSALAAQAAQAYERARLYASEHVIAKALQQGLLPPRLPEIPAAELAARYRPAGEGVDVGGDFYDAFRLHDERWALLVGDVCGTGPVAAAMTAQVRHTVRALAPTGLPLEALLARLNDALAEGETDGRFCTLVYIELEPADEGLALRIASAGHPRPLLLRAGHEPEEVGGTGPLLGMAQPFLARSVDVHLRAGDSLLAFTDGVLEARPPVALRPHPQCFFGVEGVVSLVRSLEGESADRVAGAVDEAVLAYAGGRLDDDLAVLVIRATGNRATG